MTFPKFAWAASRISDSDMALLYRMKMQTRKPITRLVAEAVNQYLLSKEAGA